MIVLLALLFAGCLFLWVGVPLLWLWIGSQIQAAVSLGTALAVSMVGAISTIILLVWVLARIDHRYVEMKVARGGEPEEAAGALEPMIVASAAVAVLLFAVWFLVFAGTSPVPLNIGY